jgi:hypothetical protein
VRASKQGRARPVARKVNFKFQASASGGKLSDSAEQVNRLIAGGQLSD